MKNIIKIQLLSFMILSINACSQDTINVAKTALEYESCCGIDPYEYNVEFPDGSMSYIYVPNVFTPNGDGINDLFSPVFNDQIDHFENLLIRKEDAKGDRILLYQTDIIDATNIKEKSWNGRDQNNKFHKGVFNYTVNCVTKSGKVFGIQSQACSVICGDDASVFKDNNACFFSSQSDSNGRLIKTLSSKELNCF